jgi:dTDP-4-amino-4,6-dideoxygalactose transaminase
MKVPLLDLQAQYLPIRDEILAAMTRVADSQRFIMGPEIDALEWELSAMLGIRHAIAVSSGTDALLLALMALDINAGDEVITPTYSFFATAGCVSRLGARPVLVDIDPVTFNIDVAQAIAAITPRTKAIMPVHLFGQSADLAPILDAAGRAGIAVVEDAAQAIGATYHARPVGGIGAFGCFSFFPSKNLGAFGTQGSSRRTTTALADRARLLRTHGMQPKYYHHVVGANFRWTRCRRRFCASRRRISQRGPTRARQRRHLSRAVRRRGSGAIRIRSRRRFCYRRAPGVAISTTSS